jgi:transposase
LGFIGGILQEQLVGRIRDAERDRLLAVPIDVGKRAAAALVCDFWGEIVVEPFEFILDEAGFCQLNLRLARASAERDAIWVRIGVEQAGHYHQPLVARLQAASHDVVVFNPAQVKDDRAQDLLRTLKSDARDLGALADLLIRGKGRPPIYADAAMATQAVLAVHRARKVKARTMLKNQIVATLDLVFAGLDGCFSDIFNSRFGRLLLNEGFDPGRVRRLGPERLLAFAQHRGLRTRRSTVARVVATARGAFELPSDRVRAHAGVLAADVAMLKLLDSAVADAEAELAAVLPDTPAGILTTIPYVGVVRASDYGAAVGDLRRFARSAQVYRASGLAPKLYESAGRRRPGTHISKEGKVELRQALLELGIALRSGHVATAHYAATLKERGKGPGVVACALAHRANRIAFAMVRDQIPFDSSRW